MAGWHHWLNRCESEWTPGVGDGQGDLAYCSSWGRKESDTTERLNWTELMVTLFLIFKGNSILLSQLHPHQQCRRVPWTARRSSQSILKEISPGCSLQGLMLKAERWAILWPPHAKSWLIGKDSDAGSDLGAGGERTTEDEMAGWHHGIDGRWVWVNSGRWWWTERPGVWFMGSQRVGHNWATELNWTDTLITNRIINNLV